MVDIENEKNGKEHSLDIPGACFAVFSIAADLSRDFLDIKISFVTLNYIGGELKINQSVHPAYVYSKVRVHVTL